MTDHPNGLSRRSLLRLLGTSAPSVLLTACSEGTTENLTSFEQIKQAPARSAIEDDPTLFVATTRKPVNGGLKTPWYGTQRADVTSFVRVKLNPPDRTVLGSVTAPITGDWSIASVTPIPVADAGRALGERASGRDLLIYVHGFNETFESAVLGVAAFSHGVRFKGVTALFTWPSRGDLLDYGYDRESALWSRDAFEELLETIAKEPVIGRIHIVAHSMGTLLTLEAIRELKNRTGDQYVGKFGAIVLASPDIDVDIFTQTVSKLGYYAKKITVITSTDDRALAISRRLAGGVTRVGAAQSDMIRSLGVKVVDASGVDWQIIGHDRFLTDETTRTAIRNAIDTAS